MTAVLLILAAVAGLPQLGGSVPSQLGAGVGDE
eukprot:SAG11_NODE_21913_length_416_cov_0.813880_1_plen_32_part_10